MGSKGITDRVVALTIKKAAERVDIDAASLAGHSLRSGLATTAARNGASEASIMKQTGHPSVQMVRRYIRGARCSTTTPAPNWACSEPRADPRRPNPNCGPVRTIMAAGPQHYRIQSVGPYTNTTPAGPIRPRLKLRLTRTNQADWVFFLGHSIVYRKG